MATPTTQTRDTGSTPATFKSFDYVIVGGGLSGLVLATRLSEDPDVSVGVLESGLWRPDDEKINTPYRMMEMVGDPDYHFVGFTVPQKHAGGRKILLPRGRTLGGGSAVNFLVWHRGSKKEYDDIERLGNPGWNWDTLSRAGMRSETFTAPNNEAQKAVSSWNEATRGQQGPVQTSFPGWVHESHNAFFEVMRKFGLVDNKDWYDGDNTGIRTSTNSIDPLTGKRSSSASGYYAPNASRPNLSVLCGAHASKVLFDKPEGLLTAKAVEYVHGGQKYVVEAKREVILSAGAFQSPQLLELSGIGNPKILEPLGIDVNVDNANVGENMQDHLMAFMIYRTKSEHVTQDGLDDLDSKFAADAREIYKKTGGDQNFGPMGVSVSALLYTPLKQYIRDEELEAMKKKLLSQPLSHAAQEGLQFQLDSLDDPDKGTMEWVYIPRKFPSPTPAEPGRSYISLMVSLQHPFSRGHSHITTADPMAEPDSDPNYMANEFDRRILVHSLKELDKAAKTEPLSGFIESRVDPAPGDDSLEAFDKFLTETAASGIHWIGTASMLPREKGGVVDPKCKVYGTSNLRVVDASIIPLHLSAHLQATMYAIAEHAAEIIKADARAATGGTSNDHA